MEAEMAEFAPAEDRRIRVADFASLSAFRSGIGAVAGAGPVALILLDDSTEVESTLTYHATLGFGSIVLFGDTPDALPADLPCPVHRVACDTTADGALVEVANAAIAALPGRWLYYGFNAEYLYYPFCEDRSVGEMLTFMTEERRDSVMTYVVDLYPQDLSAHPDGVDRAHAHFDGSGYYALARKDAEGHALDRQIDVFGGLRWRFEEHIAKARQSLNRVALFRAVPGLKMLPDRSFNMEEMNTVSCPWHNNLTAAVASFRTAKALRRNPGSRHAITTFHCPQSQRFDWQSQQLLDLGLMEPGQWF